MVFTSNNCKNLNSIVWLFGIKVLFLMKVWSSIEVNMVRNCKINKIVITKIAISQDPEGIMVRYFRNRSTLNR